MNMMNVETNDSEHQTGIVLAIENSKERQKNEDTEKHSSQDTDIQSRENEQELRAHEEIYLEVLPDGNLQPFPHNPAKQEINKRNVKIYEGLQKDCHPFPLPPLPKEAWPEYKKTICERLNPLQLRNKTIFMIVIVAVIIILSVAIVISRFILIENDENEGNVTQKNR